MSEFPELDKLKNNLDACVTCGMCHAVCPTYHLSERELLSPRGRILLLRRLMKGDILPDEISPDAFDFCTLCYACQTACPAGVRTDLLFIAARQSLAEANGIERTKKLVFQILEKPSRVNLVVKAAALTQKLFGKRTVDSIAGGMAVPDLRMNPYLREIPEELEPEENKTLRIGFFLGCMSNYVDERAAKASLLVLQKLGCEIVTPPGQVCCGAPAFNNGDFETAVRLAKINLKLFEEAEVDYIVSPDATCGGAFRHEIPHLMQDEDDEWYLLADQIAKKTIDWPSLVNDKLNPSFPKTNSPPISVTIHDSCHLTHTQKANGKVRELLSKLPGVKIIEMEESTICCGFGGSFSSLYSMESREWTQRKLDNVTSTGVQVAIASSPGCIAQLKRGAEDRQLRGIRFKHPAEFIAERCGWMEIR